MRISISPRNLLIVAGAVALAVIIYLWWDWQPQRQAEKAFQRFLTTVEKRDWVRVAELMAPDYQDGWGFDRSQVVSHGSEALSQFFWITLTPIDPRVEVDGRQAGVSSRIEFDGRGTGLADYALTRAKALGSDFQFAFRRDSWKPWDWSLTGVHQPELKLDSNYLP